jgi:uncharacterized membrane protein
MLTNIIETIAIILGVLGGIVAVWGSVHALVRIIGYWFSKKKDVTEATILDQIRVDFGRHIVLALEFFIAKDLLETIFLPGWNEVGQLAVLVIVRTVISYFLTKELHQKEINILEHKRIDKGIT